MGDPWPAAASLWTKIIRPDLHWDGRDYAQIALHRRVASVPALKEESNQYGHLQEGVHMPEEDHDGPEDDQDESPTPEGQRTAARVLLACKVLAALAAATSATVAVIQLAGGSQASPHGRFPLPAGAALPISMLPAN